MKTATRQPTETRPTASLTATSSPIAAEEISLVEPKSRENTPIPGGRVALYPENADQIVSLAQWGKGSIQDIAYAVDGTQIGVATSLGVYLYDTQSFERITFYPASSPVSSLAFSPDQETFAWGLESGQIEIHKVKDGSLRHRLESEPLPVFELAYTGDGEHLVSIHQDRTHWTADPILTRWSLTEEKALSTHGFYYYATYDLSDNGEIIGWTDGDSIQVRDISDRNSQSVSDDNYPYYMKFSPDGNTFLFVDVTGVSIYQTQLVSEPVQLSGVPQFIDRFHAYTCHIEADGPGRGNVKSAAFSPDGQRVAISANVGEVQIRRVSDGAVLSSFSGWASQMVFAPDSKTFALVTGDGVLEFRNASNGALIQQIAGHLDAYTSLDFSPDGKYLAAGAADERARIWRIPDGTRAYDLQIQANQVAFSPDGSLLATGSKYGGVALWNLASGEVRQLQKDHSKQYEIYRVNALEFTPNEQSLIAGSQDCYLDVWNTQTGRKVESIVNGLNPSDIYALNDPVVSVGISPEANTVLTNYWNSILQFDLGSGKLLSQLSMEEFVGDEEILYLHQSNRFALGSSYAFQIWQTEPLNLVYTQEGPGLNMVLSPDGLLIATGDRGGNIYLWLAEDGQPLARMQGHRYEITDLAFSPDGNYLASSSRDGTIRLWGIP